MRSGLSGQSDPSASTISSSSMHGISSASFGAMPGTTTAIAHIRDYPKRFLHQHCRLLCRRQCLCNLHAPTGYMFVDATGRRANPRVRPRHMRIASNIRTIRVVTGDPSGEATGAALASHPSPGRRDPHHRCVGTTDCGLIHEYELAASVSESSFRTLRPELALLIASHQDQRAVLEDHASGC